MNYNGSIDLLKLRGARKSMVSGQRCIIIPVDENPTIYVGEKGCYLGLSVRETSNSSYGDSHFIAASISSKDIREKIGRDNIKQYTPILGNLKESNYGGGNEGFGEETEQPAQGYAQPVYPQQSYPQQGGYPQQAYPQPGYPQQQPMYDYARQQGGYPAPNPNDMPV